MTNKTETMTTTLEEIKKNSVFEVFGDLQKQEDLQKTDKEHINPYAEERKNFEVMNDFFVENPLIQELSSLPQWTISTKDKRPLNARLAIDTNFKDFKLFKEADDLVTLDELNQYKRFDNSNRAFYFTDNQYMDMPYICIDIEPTGREELVQKAMKLPFEYGEISKSGGLHLLIRVPRHCITRKTEYLFEDISVLKHPSGEIEVIFDRHFVTFTKKVIEGPNVDLSTPDTPDSLALTHFLEGLTVIDEKARHFRQVAKDVGRSERPANLDIDNVSQEAKNLATFVSPYKMDELKKLRVTDFMQTEKPDYSRYEYTLFRKFSLSVLAQVTKNKKNRPVRQLIGKEAVEINEWDLALGSYDVLKDIIPFRPKHNEQRNGLPYLFAIALKACIDSLGTHKLNEQKNAEEKRKYYRKK